MLKPTTTYHGSPPYKIESDGLTFIKVINFPGHESMWVVQISGDDNNGVGHIANIPVCSDLELDAKVKYEGGTDNQKPSFGGLV